MAVPRSPWPSRARVLTLLVVAAASAVASFAVAERAHTVKPATIVVGMPPGFAPTHRLDPGRKGQAVSALPSAPRQLWERPLAGGLEQPPLVDAKGGLIAALTTPDLVCLDAADGRQLWRTRTGSEPAVVPPVITSDGSIAVVSEDGTLWLVSAGGRVRFGAGLGLRTKKAQATPLARDDGSLVVAGENGLVHVASDGTVLARTRITARPVGGLIPWRRGVLVTTHGGDVYLWRAPATPRKVGAFGGQLEGGGTLVGPRTLVGVVEQQRVVALDLVTGSATLLAGGDDPLVQFEGPASLDFAGLLLVTSVAGELFGIDPQGVLVRRLALERLPMFFGADGGAPLPSIFRRPGGYSSPPLVVDSSGRIGFVRSSGKVGVIDSKGSVATVNQRFCARPLAVLPAGTGRIIVACKSGLVALYGDK
ncbi:MAG: PQQ-binding-like beta-propeller repeat protein [Deltaproteobacteria bacterium]|nr:PQQ-binding-like beta-propeller repeat protein [Deltaproteobacteria bacterium]